MAGMVSSSAENQHCDDKPAQIKRIEKAVEKVKVAIQHFLNPFILESKDIVILSSGATASTCVTAGLLKARSS